MPLFVYQIGDFPIFNNVRGVDRDSFEIETSRAWRIGTQQLPGVSGVVRHNDPTKPLSSSSSISVNGAFVFGEGGSIDYYINHLMRLGGINSLPIIGMWYEEQPDCEAELRWFYARGAVLTVERSSELLDQDGTGTMVQPFSVDIEIDPTWRFLSEWLWEYRTAPIVGVLSNTKQWQTWAAKFSHPQKLNQLSTNGSFYFWGDDWVQYAPDFWSYKYSQNNHGGIGSSFGPAGITEFLTTPLTYSAPPHSVYAFTGLSNVGEIILQVNRQSGVFGDYVVEQAIADLSQIDLDLNTLGFTGLNSNDIIITGDVFPSPGFVLRNNEIIDGYVPSWEFSTRYVGETGYGHNIVSADFVGGAIGSWAYLHEWSRY